MRTAAERAAEATRQAAAAAEAARAAAHVDAVVRVPLWGHAVLCAASVALTVAAAAWVAHRLYKLEKRSEVRLQLTSPVMNSHLVNF